MIRVNPASVWQTTTDDVVSWPGKIGKSVEYKTQSRSRG